MRAPDFFPYFFAVYMLEECETCSNMKEAHQRVGKTVKYRVRPAKGGTAVCIESPDDMTVL